MKLLVVSHNVLSLTDHNGKTLLSYFGGWEPSDLAQLYIQAKAPTLNNCGNYYRVTDKDMLKSIFTRKSGKSYGKADIKPDSDTPELSKLYENVYRIGSKRKPIMYFLRDLLWRMGNWNTGKLKKWVADFAPDAVYFASGGSSFTYRIALKIAKTCGCPLFISCFDDYYFTSPCKGYLGAGIAHKIFMRQVKKTMNYASCIFTICDKMREDYSKLFNKDCYTLHTASTVKEPFATDGQNKKISYIGNLELERHKQLIAIGKALKGFKDEGLPCSVDIYSGTTSPDILNLLTPENGVNFHGSIDADEVKKVMSESMLLIHTESFDQKMRLRTAYSVSTKIADSLASGICILAYGPKEVASVKYLRENAAAFCITDSNELESGLMQIISDGEKREQIAKSALYLAHKNHLPEKVQKVFYENIYKYTEAWRQNSIKPL